MSIAMVATAWRLAIGSPGWPDLRPSIFRLLRSLGLKPGMSLIGFDAGQAKNLLEGIDWVEQAEVQRKFPNQLEISVVERVPFAVWQRSGDRYVIDRNGVAMSGIEAGRMAQLPLVSGEGANLAAGQLMADLEQHPDLMLRVGAAARVGQRRWNLYLDNGVKVMLPENDEAAALQMLAVEDQRTRLLSDGVQIVDLRIAGQMRLALTPIAQVLDSKSERTQVE
jgi:cell division protein FtsQ